MGTVPLAMAKWTLECRKCWALFEYLPAGEQTFADYFLPTKPDFPPGGSDIKCPNCGHVARYQRTDLIYVKTKSAGQ
jgi:hypothetical protein